MKFNIKQKILIAFICTFVFVISHCIGALCTAISIDKAEGNHVEAYIEDHRCLDF